jgi:predicted RNA-binding protein
MRELISSIMAKGAYKEAICYLEGAMSVFPQAQEGGVLNGAHYVNVPETVASGGGLSRLREVVSEAVGRHDRGQAIHSPDVEELLSLVRFSLDMDLSGQQELSSRYDRVGQVLQSGRKRLVELRTNGPQPTVHCGKLVWGSGPPLNGRKVEIEDFQPKGTVFSQGIRSVSGRIRPGDLVLVGTGERFKAVGRALVPGLWMTAGRRGDAVRVLDHV